MDIDIEFKPKPKRSLQSLRAKVPPSIYNSNDRELPTIDAYIAKIECLLSTSCTIPQLIKFLIFKYYTNPTKPKQPSNHYNRYDIANITFRCKPHKSIKSLPTYIDYQSIPNNAHKMHQNINHNSNQQHIEIKSKAVWNTKYNISIDDNNDNDEEQIIDLNVNENNEKQLKDWKEIDEIESMSFIMNDDQTQSFINDELEIAYNDNINDENSNVSENNTVNNQQFDFDAFFNERKKTFDTMIKTTENKNSDDYIVYITWNIWYNNNIALIQRIKAIGDIIECNKCDIICLQEVTHQSFEMIQQCKWYIIGGYKSIDIRDLIIPQFGEKHRKYWNVIITKHEFISNKLYWKRFEQTSNVRHMILVPIKLKHCNKIIYVGTTHLKSAVGKESNKCSFTRKQELKCCMNILDDNNKCHIKNNNVIFGGDLNWFDSTKNKQYDGDINKCLNNHWIDGYQQLYPNSDGFTYDTKSNPMLTSNLRGSRLDRIIYKNNGDLNLESIQIIGKEAIPDINYHKIIIKNGKEVHKILNVLPSDHYGLCAQFTLRQ